MISNIASLVDAFVATINGEPREPEPLEDVPEFLREETPDGPSEVLEGWTSWRIVKRDNSADIDRLERRIERSFPPSFRYFLANYSFPAFDAGPLTLFANTGEDVRRELGRKLFLDPHMSSKLLHAGFIQIGNPFVSNYDPVCFDCSSPGPEKRIVQLDHEDILQRGEMHIVRDIARSFLALIHDAVR
jgi:hypothetical protein